MHFFYGLLLIIGLMELPVSSAANLPSIFKTCKLMDPNLSECVKSSVNAAMVEFSKGLPKLGMIPLDPLQIDRMELPSEDGPVQLTQIYTNSALKGIENMIMNQFHVNPKTLDMEYSFSGDFELFGDYEITGRMLVLPISGNGKYAFELHNANISHFTKAEVFESKGKKYMKFKGYRTNIDAAKEHMNYENLFGDKKLSDGMNKFINEHIDEIFPEIKKPFQQTFALMFQDLANRILTKVPLTELFPDDKF